MISEAALVELKLRNPCDQVAGRWVTLRRHGKKFIGPCPLHSPDPTARDSTSFECDADGWVCATCHAGGDVIKLMQLREGCDFVRAIELLGGTAEPDPERAAELEREQARRKDKREREADAFRERERRTAFDIWHAGQPWPGTPVETYLRQARSLTVLPDQLRLRFAPTVAYFKGEEEDERGLKVPRVIYCGPAMLAPIVDAGGTFRAVHITWLDLARPKGKALIRNPDDGEELPAKKVRGSKQGNVIRLVDAPLGGPPQNEELTPGTLATLYIGEGIETVLSVWLSVLLSGRDVSRVWFWSSVDLGNLAGKADASVVHPTLKDGRGRPLRVPGFDPDSAEGFALPAGTSHVVLLADGDSDAFTTQCAIHRATVRLIRRGIAEVRTAWAPAGKDFNDLLRGK